MPLVGFRPTKARLVIEDGRESVLVMKVVLDAEDAVELSAGGTLAALTGVLRIRERRNGAGNGGKPIGSMVYVAETGPDNGTGLRALPGQRRDGRGQVRDAAAHRHDRAPAHEVLRRRRRAAARAPTRPCSLTACAPACG